jgi:prepilin-type processing-associated H-X9-DG protein
VGCGQTVAIPPFRVPAEGLDRNGRTVPSSVSKVSSIALAVVIVLIVSVFLAVYYGLPGMEGAREAARRSRCSNNLKQIGLALHNYHDAYKSFPPAFVPDENGEAIHSWRVAILPFLEQQALFNQYEFKQPWNGPRNQRLHDVAIEAYRCPSDSGKQSTHTSYVMIVGEDTVSDGPGMVHFREIKDGTSNTIIVAELEQSGIHWMEPRDMSLEDFLSFQRSGHPHVVNVLFCDGSVRAISDVTDAKSLQALCTIDGGEVISD